MSIDYVFFLYSDRMFLLSAKMKYLSTMKDVYQEKNIAAFISTPRNISLLQCTRMSFSLLHDHPVNPNLVVVHLSEFAMKCKTDWKCYIRL